MPCPNEILQARPPKSRALSTPLSLSRALDTMPTAPRRTALHPECNRGCKPNENGYLPAPPRKPHGAQAKAQDLPATRRAATFRASARATAPTARHPAIPDKPRLADRPTIDTNSSSTLRTWLGTSDTSWRGRFLCPSRTRWSGPRPLHGAPGPHLPELRRQCLRG